MGKKLFVGRLSYSTTDDSLRAAFEAFGEVEEARVIYDRTTGDSRGFGFVSYVDDSVTAMVCAKMDGAMLDGRTIRVNEAEDRRGPPGPGGEGGGPGGGRGMGRGRGGPGRGTEVHTRGRGRSYGDDASGYRGRDGNTYGAPPREPSGDDDGYRRDDRDGGGYRGDGGGYRGDGGGYRGDGGGYRGDGGGYRGDGGGYRGRGDGGGFRGRGDGGYRGRGDGGGFRGRGDGGGFRGRGDGGGFRGRGDGGGFRGRGDDRGGFRGRGDGGGFRGRGDGGGFRGRGDDRGGFRGRGGPGGGRGGGFGGATDAEEDWGADRARRAALTDPKKKKKPADDDFGRTRAAPKKDRRQSGRSWRDYDAADEAEGGGDPGDGPDIDAGPADTSGGDED